MRFPFLLIALILVTITSAAVTVDEGVRIEGNHIRLQASPADGGALREFGWVGAEENFAGAEGLLVEGFGVGSFYVGGRRLNETLEVLESYTDRPVVRYSYDGDGPNLRGLHSASDMDTSWNGWPIRSSCEICPCYPWRGGQQL